ncbi:MAG TPA: hypothetical protein PLU22_15135 [Polyangiaceae bacterium]|nr:hypothetical protein [Polyangiaceae bacterium]
MRSRAVVERATPSRRAFLTGLVAAPILLATTGAWAGSYLDRAAMLIGQAAREAEYLRARLSDRELARTVQRLAAARAKAGSTMLVPEEVAKAHPHLLLVLAGYERAATAAAEGDAGRFFVAVEQAREEEEIFRGVLRQLGWTLPRY